MVLINESNRGHLNPSCLFLRGFFPLPHPQPHRTPNSSKIAVCFENRIMADVTSIIDQIRFRTVRPTDIPVCFSIERSSYPANEAASKSNLQYRQHHAARYFRCAVIGEEEDDEEIIGFICSTRCHEFNAESMSTHHTNGQFLAIHSVVTEEKYQRKGFASAMMKDYIQVMKEMKDVGVQKIVLLSKVHLLAFYVDRGFSVIGRSSIQHGDHSWYELQLDLSFENTSGLPYYIVDSFAKADSLGSGNPAAVVKLHPGTDPSNPDLVRWMLIVAKEFNLSETAFIWPHEEEKQGREVHWYIRFFSPKMEIPLCGHATLAAAGVLYQTLVIRNKNETSIVFHAQSNILTTQLSAGGLRSRNGRAITNVLMKFPSKPAIEIETDSDKVAVQDMILRAFNIKPDCILFLGISGTGDLLVEIKPDTLLSIGYEGIQHDALMDWDGYARGIIICSIASNDQQIQSNQRGNEPVEKGKVSVIDFFSRFFGPKVGIVEDPVTGSAHCALGPYFATKLGKSKVIGKQLSERGGIVECNVDVKEDIVKITGTAVKTMSGFLHM